MTCENCGREIVIDHKVPPDRIFTLARDGGLAHIVPNRIVAEVTAAACRAQATTTDSEGPR